MLFRQSPFPLISNLPPSYNKSQAPVLWFLSSALPTTSNLLFLFMMLVSDNRIDFELQCLSNSGCYLYFLSTCSFWMFLPFSGLSISHFPAQPSFIFLCGAQPSLLLLPTGEACFQIMLFHCRNLSRASVSTRKKTAQTHILSSTPKSRVCLVLGRASGPFEILSVKLSSSFT